MHLNQRTSLNRLGCSATGFRFEAIHPTPLVTGLMVRHSAANSSSEDRAKSKNTSQFVGFEIDRQQYAVRIEQIQEIVILDQITPTPQVAGHVEGVSNLRGEIIPIINLRMLLGLPAKPADAETRTIVVNVGERTMGCTVDAVSQVIRIANDSIQPAPEALTGNGENGIAGFAKLGDALVIILNVDELLRPERLKWEPKAQS